MKKLILFSFLLGLLLINSCGEDSTVAGPQDPDDALGAQSSSSPTEISSAEETSSNSVETSSNSEGISSIVEDLSSNSTQLSSSSADLDPFPVVSSSSSVEKSSSSQLPSSSSEEIKVLLVGNDIHKDGPLATVIEHNKGPEAKGVIVRPKDLTNSPNEKHPLIIWGPGGGSEPLYYEFLLRRLASMGFVVYSEESNGEGSEMFAALNWLEQQAELKDKLLFDRVGVAGHSWGGLSAEGIASRDQRVVTALLANSGAFGGDGNVNMKVPVALIYGDHDDMAKPNAINDYNNPANKNPLWLGGMKGGGHGSGPWDGAGAIIAWLRWHVGGEENLRNEFLGHGGEFNNNGIWITSSKNW